MREPFSCVFVAVRAMLFAVAGSRFACKNAVLDGPIARSQNCLFSERGRLYSLDKKNDTVAKKNVGVAFRNIKRAEFLPGGIAVGAFCSDGRW